MAAKSILALATFAGMLFSAAAARAESPPAEAGNEDSRLLVASSSAAQSDLPGQVIPRVAKITLARPVGRVNFAADAPLLGEMRYADRSGDGSIRFVTAGPRSPIAGGMPGRLPVVGMLTSPYGMRTHPVHGGRRWHGGVDLAAPAGTPVHATSDGVVVNAGWAGGYGLLVKLSHGGLYETQYGHLRQISVKAGQLVKRGDVIGQVGSTGNSTGPHVHYELRVAGRPVDPMKR